MNTICPTCGTRYDCLRQGKTRKGENYCSIICADDMYGNVTLFPSDLGRSVSTIGLMALTAMLAGAAMYLPGGGGPSGQSIRNDPDREKTPDDLRKLEAGRLKRERKAAKHFRHNKLLGNP